MLRAEIVFVIVHWNKPDITEHALEGASRCADVLNTSGIHSRIMVVSNSGGEPMGVERRGSFLMWRSSILSITSATVAPATVP